MHGYWRRTLAGLFSFLGLSSLAPPQLEATGGGDRMGTEELNMGCPGPRQWGREGRKACVRTSSRAALRVVASSTLSQTSPWVAPTVDSDGEVTWRPTWKLPSHTPCSWLRWGPEFPSEGSVLGSHVGQLQTVTPPLWVTASSSAELSTPPRVQ